MIAILNGLVYNMDGFNSIQMSKVDNNSLFFCCCCWFGHKTGVCVCRFECMQFLVSTMALLPQMILTCQPASLHACMHTYTTVGDN